MKIIWVLSIIFVTVLSGLDPVDADQPAVLGPDSTYFLHEENGVLVREELKDVPINTATSPSDVTYYFSSNLNPQEGYPIKSDDVRKLDKTKFNVVKDTILIIHGWKNNNVSDVNVLIKKSLFSKYDVNVFVVDWSPVASRNYVSARWAVNTIGGYVADFLKRVVHVYSLKLSKVSIVGHSLGAHVSGLAGKGLNQVSNIVGLDPAWPLFYTSSKENRLDKGDAKFVQVIHTCTGYLGFSSPLGQSDYYPNGGRSQAGCGVDAFCTCAHSRAYWYFAESVAPLAKAFRSAQCPSYSDYNQGKCTSNPHSNMGGIPVDTTASGIYYLTTNTEPPFARG